MAGAGAANAILGLSAALQAVVFLAVFGADARTDGFFAAYGLYTVVVLFGQVLRTTSLPLLASGDSPLDRRAFVTALVSFAVFVLAVGVGAAPLLAVALGPDLPPSAQEVTTEALRVLSLGASAQILTAGASTLLGLDGRLGRASAAYAAGAVASLIAFVALIAPADELALAAGTVAGGLISAALTLSAMHAGVLAPSRGALRRVPANIARLAWSCTVPLGLTVLYPVTLALASGAPSGEVTLLAYAYTAAAYVAGFTSGAIGLNLMIELAPAGGPLRAMAQATIPAGFRYSAIVALPTLGLVAGVGAPLLHEAVSTLFTSTDADTFQEFTWLLVPWTLATLVINVSLPALYAAGWMRRLNLAMAWVLPLHIACGVAVAALLGPAGVAACAAVAPAVLVAYAFAAALGRAGAPLAVRLVRDAAATTALAGGCFWSAVGLAAALGGSAAAVAASGVAALGLAALAVRVIYRPEWRVLVSLGHDVRGLRRGARPRSG